MKRLETAVSSLLFDVLVILLIIITTNRQTPTIVQRNFGDRMIEIGCVGVNSTSAVVHIGVIAANT